MSFFSFSSLSFLRKNIFTMKIVKIVFFSRYLNVGRQLNRVATYNSIDGLVWVEFKYFLFVAEIVYRKENEGKDEKNGAQKSSNQIAFGA